MITSSLIIGWFNTEAANGGAYLLQHCEETLPLVGFCMLNLIENQNDYTSIRIVYFDMNFWEECMWKPNLEAILLGKLNHDLNMHTRLINKGFG